MKSNLQIFMGLVIMLMFTRCSITKHHISKSEKVYSELNATIKDVKLDSSTIHLRIVGKGENVLLLIHGFGPVPQIQWENLVEEINEDFTLYIPDLIYLGASRSEYDQFDPRFQSRQIYQLLKKEGITRLSVGGVSYGGLISEIFAHQHPNMVENLILIDALSPFTSRKYADSLAKQFGFQNIGEILVPENGKALKTLFDITFYHPPKYPAFALNKPSRLLYSDQRRQKKELMDYLFAHENEMKKWDLSYNGNVNIIWGKEDILIPVNTGYKLNGYYPNSEMNIIPKAAHAVNMENAEEVGSIIKEIKKPAN